MTYYNGYYLHTSQAGKAGIVSSLYLSCISVCRCKN